MIERWQFYTFFTHHCAVLGTWRMQIHFLNGFGNHVSFLVAAPVRELICKIEPRE